MTAQTPTFTIPGDLFARAQTISGLRALADFLETNPAVSVPVYGWTLAFYTRGDSEASERAELGRIAGHLDQTPTDNTATGGHLTVSMIPGSGNRCARTATTTRGRSCSTPSPRNYGGASPSPYAATWPSPLACGSGNYARC